MVLDLVLTKNIEIKNLYEEIIPELKEWYNFNWERNLPKVFIIEDKETFTELYHGDSEEYVIGFADYNNNIFIYSPEASKKHTIHDKDMEDYRRFLKHELDHCFFNIYTKGLRKPRWLVEGNAIYVSGQYKKNKKVEEFKYFLDMYDNFSQEGYPEAGIVIKLLVEKVGKERYLEFLRDLSKKNFEEEFENIFGVKLNYESFNKFFL